MWETLYDTVVLAIVGELLLRPIREQWHRRGISQTVAALNRGKATRIRCAARFRNSGGGRHRARLTVTADGVFLSTVDSTVAELRLGTPHTSVEVVAEHSMMVCSVAGRQLEIWLPAEEDRLFKAVVARLLDHGDEHSATAGIVPRSDSGSAPPHKA
ncbi:hypothetical protein ABZ341_27680 [Streptomyces sp. NPDC006173]|uniref:hypothetical protein n=1 Tax=Streptomyces sp. NPDC006173 TaxID=3155349 RepID=UPI0033E91667